ncbi:DNA integrity scanning diadenylate cyclase DisA [Salininema proteolyticum]|uniref:DNA integrity scanning protein DisA n=1 Tax=Salininema proteolyticum TaxID=1607685 RepID=A0ABV8TTX2_9ACTN
MAGAPDEDLRLTLATMAPGTALRDGLERILRGRTGALIVLGSNETVDHISTGGFELDVEFSATRLRELCKMDGAVVMTSDLSRIVRAGVHLMPDAAIPSRESGTRHRTAERVALQTGYPVISVSQSMNTIGLYFRGLHHLLEPSTTILSRANQALATLERYKQRLDQVASNLFALEVEDLVTIRDVVLVVQRLEMARHIADEVEGHVIELGTDGRLLALQLDELMAGVGRSRELVVRDYVPDLENHADILREVDAMSSIDLLDLGSIGHLMGFDPDPDLLEQRVSPRGYRLLSKLPRLPEPVVDRVVRKFEVLPRLLGASVEDLRQVTGVGPSRAVGIRDGLTRIAESSILERYL